MKRKSIHSPEHRELVTQLIDYRKEADMTQTQAAKKLGQRQTYISAVEVGRRGIDLLQVRELCAVYGVSFPEFAEQFEKRMKASTSQQRPPRLSTRKRAASKKTAKSKTSKGSSKSK
jgi:transcriptional regulator with XRE-family HTH domain